MSASLEHLSSWEGSGLAFIFRQFLQYPPPIPSSANLAGKTIIVTGASSGLGLEALRQFLQLGVSRAVLAVRSAPKGAAVAEKLRREFPNAQIEVLILDMASYDSIKAFTKECQNLKRLDIAILNAGVQSHHFERNGETGHESTFQINYLSTIFLATLLIPLMKSKPQGAQPARLSIIGSDMAYSAKLDATGPIIPKFNQQQEWDEYLAYSNSKLAQIAAVRTLAEKTSAEEVIINVINPGLCFGTGIKKKNGGRFLDAIMVPAFINFMGRSAKSGASVYVNGAVVLGPESHGSFVSDWTIKPFPKFLYTEEGKEFQHRLWEETAKELGL